MDFLGLLTKKHEKDAKKKEKLAEEQYDKGNYEKAIEFYESAIAKYKVAIKCSVGYQVEIDRYNMECIAPINKRIQKILSENKHIKSKFDESDDSDDDVDDDYDDKEDDNDTSISIQIISDIHLEFDGKHGTYKKMPKLENKDDKASILALLGDIGYPSMEIYEKFIQDIREKYKYILIITGNHEYYDEKKEMYQINQCIDKIVNKYENVYFLNKKAIEFEDLSPNIRFIGTTLWTKYPSSLKHSAKLALSDFRYIKIDQTELEKDIEPENENESQMHASSEEKDEANNEAQEEQKDQPTQSPTETKSKIQQDLDSEKSAMADLIPSGDDEPMDDMNNKEQGKSVNNQFIIRDPKPLQVDDVNKLYDDQLKWIKKEIIRAKKDKKKLIILTHHSPTSYQCLSVLDEMRDVKFVTNFSSLESLFKYPVIAWCFGHTHTNTDFMVVSERGKSKDKDEGQKWLTRVVSNQLGYYETDKFAFESKDFDADKIITFPNKAMDNNEDNNTSDKPMGIEYIERGKLKEKLMKHKQRLSQLFKNDKLF